MIPIVTTAPIVSSKRLGAYHVVTFREHAIAAGARPGQFVNIAVEPGPLRRPFSVYLCDRGTGDVSVAFDAIGAGTRWLAEQEVGARLDVVGALGHGFEVPDPDGGADLLVGGGYGSAALAFLAQELNARGREVHAILGARNAARIFQDDVLTESCKSVTVTTDDGSAGHKGIVTDVMPDVVRSTGSSTIFACGPNRMLQAVAGVSTIPTQLAVEEFMACGLGVCWTCVLPVRVNGSVKHLRVCTEGPVFNAEQVAWA